MARNEVNRYEFIECPLPNQIMEHRTQIFKTLEKDDLRLLKIPRPHVSYFIEHNAPKKHEAKCQYDFIFHTDQGYDQFLSRCDRTSMRTARKTLHIEESERTIPVRVNSTYGKRTIDLNGEPITDHKSKSTFKDLFTRKINLTEGSDERLKFDKCTSFLVR